MKILVTGGAGFIGSHVSEYLLKRNDIVLGIDNLNDYYDVNRKLENLEVLNKYENFKFCKDDIRTTKIIEEWKPDKIIHLASMAGVRYSIEHPEVYVDVNINGFINILEQSKKVDVKQIVYASSSSVYGLNEKIPFNETDIIAEDDDGNEVEMAEGGLTPSSKYNQYMGLSGIRQAVYVNPETGDELLVYIVSGTPVPAVPKGYVLKGSANQDAIKDYEPNAIGLKALHVPETGIIDYLMVLHYILIF